MRGFKNNDSKSSTVQSIGENMSTNPFAQSSPVPAANNGDSQTFGQSSGAPDNRAAPSAIIGPKIRFKGELVGEEDLLIQGQIEGTIDLKNNTLTIGEQGTVKANVVAKAVTIEGAVEGDLFGQERISIKASSNVKGNIVADRVILEDGAKFRGSIDMDIDAHKDKFPKMGSAASAPTKSAPSAVSSPSAAKGSDAAK